jgi:SAM-dependent methyltransferase
VQRAPKEWTSRARAFWQERQKQAAAGALTGYLLDESPPAIGRRRFEGEWSQVRAWLREAQVSGGACLDLGCGTGQWLRALAGDFAVLEGWDTAPAMVQASRRTLRAAGIRQVRLRVGEITRRPGRAVFDLILVGGVLMYTPEPALGPLLRSLRRLLKPGGLLLLRESTTRGEAWAREGLALRPGLLASPGQARGLDYVALYHNKAALQAKLEAAGLRVEGVRANPHYKFSDITEDWLRRLNALSRGRLSGDPRRAAAAVELIHGWRWALLYPEYFVRHTLGWRPWKLENDWFLCRRT